MSPHPPTNGTTQPRELLEAEVRESYGRVVYTHKTQEKCADILLARLSTIKISQIILSSVITAGLLETLLGSSGLGAIVGVCASTALLGLNTYTKNSDLGAAAQKHRQTAADLWLIREKYLALLTDIRTHQGPIAELSQRRNRLLDELHVVYSAAQSTTKAAYRHAQKALQENEEMTFSDAEIDAFLPKELGK